MKKTLIALEWLLLPLCLVQYLPGLLVILWFF